MLKRKRASLFAFLALLLAVMPAYALTDRYQEVIQLPTGFRPEGIAVGQGSTFYVGSLADGAIFRGDLRDGQGSVFIPGQAGPGAEHAL